MNPLSIRDFFDSVCQSIIIIDHEYRIIFANASFCKDIQTPREHVIGNSCHMVIRQQKQPCAETGACCCVQEALQPGLPGKWDCFFSDPDGKTSDIYANAYPLHQSASGGRFTLIVFTPGDIRKNHPLTEHTGIAKTGAPKKWNMKFSHDFNDILSPIFTYSEILDGELSAASPLRKYVIGISKSAQRAMDLVKQIQLDQTESATREPAHHIKKPDRPKTPPAHHERILFVDDDYLIATAGKRLIEKIGYQVDMHICSLEALKAFREHPDAYDLAITDLNMPNMTGDILAMELMKIRPDIPVILCTGFNEMTTQTINTVGMESIINKPVTSIELSAKIKVALNRKKSEKIEGQQALSNTSRISNESINC